MIDPGKVKANLRDWMRNPSWRWVYESAPSERCRRYIAMMFYASETEEDEAFQAMDRMEEAMTKEDLTYMFNIMEGPEKERLAKLIQKLDA